MNPQHGSWKLYLDEDMLTPDLLSAGSGTASVHSLRRPGKRSANEDAAAVIPVSDDSAILAVADGMGGGMAGEEASALAVRSLVDATVRRRRRKSSSLRTAILDGIETANHKVMSLGIGAATTLAILEVQGNTVRPYHIGDSAVLVVGQRGKVKIQTVAHSPVGYAVAAGLIDEAEAMHHEKRHYVSNMVGCSDMFIEIGAPRTLAPRDSVLLASDGLMDNLHLGEVIQRIRKGPLDVATWELVENASQRMRNRHDGNPSKPDDLTVVAFRLSRGRKS
jgi:serine/threonine protein phosphatase PrpC